MSRGPALVDCHYEEMTLQELQAAIGWLSVAIHRAYKFGAEDEIVETLISWYDEAFVAYVSVDDSGGLKRWVAKGHFQPPTGWQDRAKYQKLAEQYSES